MKEELRAAEEELAAAEAARDEALALVPNPPHDSAPDGDTEDDAVEIRRFGEPPALAGCEGGERDRPLRARARRAALRLAVRLHRRRYRAARALALPLRARPRRRGRIHAGAAAGARPRGGDGRHGFLPDREVEHLRARAGRPLPHRHLRGRARRDAHDGDPRGGRAADPLRRLLDLLPARGGCGGQGHPRDVPRASVQQGRDVRLHDARGRVGRARPDGGARGGPAHAARPAVSRRQRRRRRPRRPRRQEDRHRGVVPGSGALPRGDVVLEHDRLPGPPARDPLPRRVGPRDAAHAQRHRRHRPRAARDPRELPGRGARRAARLRGAGARQQARAQA